MSDINNIFFELIRVAIGTQESLSRLPSEAEWEELLDLAEKQSLIGVCFVGIHALGADSDEGYINVGMSEDLYFDWMGTAAQINMKNEIVNQQCEDLQKRFSTEGFRSCVLKGQGNLPNYGELGLFRQSGDIDIWVEGGFEKVNSYIQGISPTTEINDHHIRFDVFEDTEVEVHYYPFKLNNPIMNRVLDSFFTNSVAAQMVNTVEIPSEKTIVAADNNFNVIYQIAHIFHHFFTEGIGLRQLMDYYFVLQAIKTDECSLNVKKVVHQLMIERFASALMWVLGYAFGLPEEKMLWKPDEKDGRFLLNEIMLAGNFGHHDERVPKNMTYWQSFWILNFRNLRLLRFNPWDWFWNPIMRIKGFIWRKLKGYK